MAKQGKTRELIKEFIANEVLEGRPLPTLQQVADGVGIKSRSGVLVHVRQLVRDRVLEPIDENKPTQMRNLRLAYLPKKCCVSNNKLIADVHGMMGKITTAMEECAQLLQESASNDH